MDTSLIQGPARRRRRRHSPEFRASVIEAAMQPGISIASVALANGLNANMLRKWVADAEADSPAPPRKSLTTTVKVQSAFLPLALPAEPAAAPAADIRVEVRRGATVVCITWPVSAADRCTAWLRDLLR